MWFDLNPDDAGVAVVQSSAPRSYFVKVDVLKRGCPNDSAACKDRAYLTPGDVVLTGKALGRYTCAVFVGGKGATTVGWMATAALVPVDPSDRAPQELTRP